MHRHRKNGLWKRAYDTISTHSKSRHPQGEDGMMPIVETKHAKQAIIAHLAGEAVAIGSLALHRQVMNLLRLWRARLRDRRELRRLYQLDDRLLRDMGLTRDDVFRELTKSLCWRPGDRAETEEHCRRIRR
jgi:uncharacterized protein YjiS (DUF1127 family)